jgi:hypothetical protein
MPSLSSFAKTYGIRGLRKKDDIKQALNDRFKTWERSVLVTNVFEETIVHLYSETFESNCMKTIKSIATNLSIPLSKEVRTEITRAFSIYFELNKPATVKRVKKTAPVTPKAAPVQAAPVQAAPVQAAPVVQAEPIPVAQVELPTPDNLYTVIAHGVKWYKNKTKEGGAQNFVLQHARPREEFKSNDVCIQSVTKSNGRMWAIVSERKLHKLVHTNFGINEIVHSFPHKVFFDFDKKGRDDNFLEKIVPEIEKYFPGADMAISGSVRDEKTSFHIVLNNWTINSIEEQQAMKLIKLDGIDPCVYNKNHNMKCVNQSKATDDRIQAAVTNGELYTHLITAYMCDDSKTVSDSKAMQEYLIQKPYNVAATPKAISPEQLNLDTMDARAIMSKTPLSPENDFLYANRVLRFVKANGISYEEFLEWAHQKHQDDKKWETQWNTADKFTPPSMESMKVTLKHMYPNAVKTEDLAFVKFRDTFDIGETVKVDRLGQEHFKEGITCVNIGMGGGKTTQTVQFIKDKNYIVISPNIALGRNMTSRLPEASFYQDIGSRTGGIDKKQLIICMNSLHYVNTTYDTVVLDEIETVLNKWNGTFMKDKKHPNFEKFVELIKAAKNVVLLDAFITRKTLDFIRSIRSDPITIIQRKDETSTKTVQYVKKFEAMVARMREDLKNGKKLFIFYPQKGQTSNISMAGLHKLLSVDGHRGVYYNSEIDDEKKKSLRNVNESWKDLDFVITNTTITVGVNYDDDAIFDSAYLFLAPYNSPRDVIQVSCRPRMLRSGMIFAHFMGKMVKTEVWLNDSAGMPAEYAPLYKSNLIELSAPTRKTFGLFCERAGYKQVTSEEDMYEHQIEKVKKLLEEHGAYFDYDSIPNISNTVAEQYQQKIFQACATQMEKVTLAKHMFVGRFRKEFRDHKEVANAWNWQKIKFTESIAAKNPLFMQIAKDNNLSGLPTDLTKVKLSDEMIARIFAEFTFRSLTPKSSHSKILFNIYNDFYGPIYKSVEKTKGNWAYVLDPAGVQEYYTFAMPATQKMRCTCGNCQVNSFGLCGNCNGYTVSQAM